MMLVHPPRNVFLGQSKGGDLVQGEVDSASFEVLADVAEDVGELESDAKRHRWLRRLLLGIPCRRTYDINKGKGII